MPELLWQSRAYVQDILFGLFVVVAFRRGAGPERLCSLALFGMFALDFAYHALFGRPGEYEEVDPGHLVIDSIVFLALLPAVWSANRVYPLWLGAAQLISLNSHYARSMLPGIQENAYAIMARVPSWIQVVAMGLGLAFHASRLKRLGSYPSWRT